MRYYDCYESTICKKKIAENLAKLIVLIIFPTSFIIIIIILLEIQNRNSKLLLSTWFYDSFPNYG